MSSAATIPMLNPATGKVHAIPTNQVDQARAAGGKPVATMRDPKGQMRYVPMDQVGDAQKAGGTLIPYGSPSSTEAAQQITGIHPYSNPIAQGIAGVGRAAAGLVTGPIKAVQSAFTAPSNPGEQAAQDQWGPLGLGFQRNIVAPAQAAFKTASGLRQAGHPIAAAGATLGALPFIGPAGQAAGNRMAAGDVPGAVTESLANAAAPAVLKAGAGAVAEPLANMARDSASGIINKSVIGARKADFARGADPGRGYMENNLGASGSMESVAEKAAAARDTVGQQIGEAYRRETQKGTLIPTDDVRQAVHSVLNQAKEDASAPLVDGDPAVYDRLKASLEPALQAADAKGGFTPSELWNIRDKLNKSLNWKDQTKATLTQTQQRISGALGGVLEDNVPGVEDLNQNYKDLVKLADRSAERASTGSSSLHGAVSKGVASGVGGMVGHSTGLGVAGGLGGAAMGAALDSVPVKTALASGVAGVGKVLQPASSLAPAAVLPATLATVPGNNQPQAPGDTQDQQSSESTADDSAQVPEENVQAAPSVPSIAPTYTPDTHSFSTSEWIKGNPDGDPDEAKGAAQSQGYTVTD
jgi:hypothetical protein